MTREGNGDIEKRLRSLTLKPAPPGLREKILGAAARHKEEADWTTPLLRWSLAACAAILALIFITDTALSRRQQDRLQAFLDGSRLTQTRLGDENSDLAEALGTSVSRELVARNAPAASRQTMVPVRRADVLKELLKEDLDGSESQKSSH